jgi:hypothetical protein
MSSKLKIGLLVAVHVVVGLLLGWGTWRETARTPVFSSSPIAMFSLFALVLSEAGLIGIWGGLSSTRLLLRIPATCAATGYVGGIQVTAMRLAEKFTLFLIIALTSLTILVLLSGLRFSRRKLRLANLANEPIASEGFQFSSRHLLFATTVVAVVLAIGRVMPTIGSARSKELLVSAILPLCLIMVELTTLWAALGIGRATSRLVVVIPTAFVVGMIPMFLVEPASGGRILVWSVIIGVQAIITAGSLLVIRSNGWRLVRGDRDEREPLGS